jgi:hypothetical protein
LIPLISASVGIGAPLALFGLAGAAFCLVQQGWARHPGGYVLAVELLAARAPRLGVDVTVIMC